MKYKDTCILMHEKINFIKIRFEEISKDGGVLMDTKSQTSFQEKAVELLHADADKIAQLIKVQMDNLTMPSCPLYEEVLDTQMFGLSREIDFAVKLGLIERDQGKQILDSLEKELSLLHDAYTDK
jgi:uncharacterized protein YlaN (UPF0358 family)